MKIAIVSSFLGQQMQGGEISTFLLADALSEQDQLFAITFRQTKSLGFPCYSFPYIKIPNQGLIIGHNLIDRHVEKKLMEILRKESPDIIHIHDFFMMVPAVRAAERLNIPTVMTVRSTTFACNLSVCLNGNNIPFNYTRKTYNQWLAQSIQETFGFGWGSFLISPWFYGRNNKLRKWFPKVKNYIAVSDFVQRQVIRTGVKHHNVSTIKVMLPNWEPLDLSSQKEIRIFTAGALTKFKGFNYVVSAFKDVVKGFPGATLRIAGEGSERKKLQQLIAKLKLTKSAKLIGKINHQQMRGEYARANFVLCPSVGPESLSRIIFEAFAMAKAVIATNVGGTPELVLPYQTGLVVAPRDTPQLTTAMFQLIRQPELCKRLGNGGHQLIRKVSDQKQLLKKHRELYQKIMYEYRVP